MFKKVFKKKGKSKKELEKLLKIYNGILIGSLAVSAAGLAVCGVAAAKAQIDSKQIKERELEDYLSKLEGEDSKESK